MKLAFCFRLFYIGLEVVDCYLLTVNFQDMGTKKIKEVGKGNRRMPWLSKAKKDVISCDKLWGGANDP